MRPADGSWWVGFHGIAVGWQWESDRCRFRSELLLRHWLFRRWLLTVVWVLRSWLRQASSGGLLWCVLWDCGTRRRTPRAGHTKRVLSNPNAVVVTSAATAMNPYRRSRFLLRIHAVSVLLVVPQFALSIFGLVWLIADLG